jgi:ribosomal protein L37AE/L43A
MGEDDSGRFGRLSPPMDNRDVRTFDEWSDHSRRPTCRAHHSYVSTVIDESHRVWVCPSCGRFSDRVESYTGGYGLVTPVSFDLDDVITVDGRVLIRGDIGAFPSDDGLDGALLNSPYEAKEDIMSFDGWRRWKPEYDAWVIKYSQVGSFASEMKTRGWRVINVHECVTEQSDIHSLDQSDDDSDGIVDDTDA